MRTITIMEVISSLSVIIMPLVICAQSQTTKAIDVVSLCEVLHHYDQYAGKIIELEADYVVNREIVGLYGSNCIVPLVIDGARRPIAAAVRVPSTKVLDGATVNFRSIQKLRETAERNPQRASDKGIHVVIRGRLNAANEIPYYVNANGERR